MMAAYENLIYKLVKQCHEEYSRHGQCDGIIFPETSSSK